MSNLCIYISAKSTFFLSWDKNDIETINSWSLPKGISDNDYSNELEEFIYSNPNIIRNNASADVIVDSMYATFSTEETDNTPNNKDLLEFAFAIPDISDYTDLSSTIETNGKDIHATFLFPYVIHNFLMRSFFPVKFRWSLEVFLNKWIKKNNIIRVDNDSYYRLFLESDKEYCYIGVFKNQQFLFANAIKRHSQNNFDYIFSEIIDSVCLDTEVPIEIHADKNIKAAIISGIESQFPSVTVKDISNDFKSSFKTYINDSPEIPLTIKNFITES